MQSATGLLLWKQQRSRILDGGGKHVPGPSTAHGQWDGAEAAGTCTVAAVAAARPPAKGVALTRAARVTGAPSGHSRRSSRDLPRRRQEVNDPSPSAAPCCEGRSRISAVPPNRGQSARV